MYKGNEKSLNMIMGDADYDDFGNFGEFVNFIWFNFMQNNFEVMRLCNFIQF